MSTVRASSRRRSHAWRHEKHCYRVLFCGFFFHINGKNIYTTNFLFSEVKKRCESINRGTCHSFFSLSTVRHLHTQWACLRSFRLPHNCPQFCTLWHLKAPSKNNSGLWADPFTLLWICKIKGLDNNAFCWDMSSIFLSDIRQRCVCVFVGAHHGKNAWRYKNVKSRFFFSLSLFSKSFCELLQHHILIKFCINLFFGKKMVAIHFFEVKIKFWKFFCIIKWW